MTTPAPTLGTPTPTPSVPETPLLEPSLLEANALVRTYPIRRLFSPPATVRAVDSVSFTLAPGRTLAIVGESGCGKSTLARMVALLDTPTAGHILIDGAPTTAARGHARTTLRRSVQMVFQDPYGSLNPRRTAAAILEEPLLIAGHPPAARRDAARAMMQSVGLRPDQAARYPHQFSGGQRQRIAIARALMLHPRIVVADEPVSALDVSVRAQVLNLLLDLQDSLRVAYLLISHDLGVVRHMADDVAVMYLGRIVEQAPRNTLFTTPRHPYTQALLAATPAMTPPKPAHDTPPRGKPLPGEPPSPLAPPPGCPYHPRCPHTVALCRQSTPPLRPLSGTLVACHLAETL